MPTLASAVTWPIDRRYFQDDIPERPLGSEDKAQSWADPLLQIDFVFLPASCFNMGERTGATAVGRVCVDELFLSRHEITNAAFRRFRSSHDSGVHNGHSLNGDDQPVVNVSWKDAVAFAAWLSDETDTSIRLPTEAEWEYACGIGWNDAEADEASSFGNLREDGGEPQSGGTVPVASFEASPHGLYDMHGNASEWVLDSYVDDVNRYGNDRNDPRVELGTTPLRVRRGGSWTSSVAQSRCAARDYYLGDLAVPHTGFRLVADP